MYSSHLQVSDEAKAVMVDCATEFIAFITSEAHDRAKAAKHSAIQVMRHHIRVPITK